MSAAAVLFSANTYQRIAIFFQLANIQWISKTSYHEIKKKTLLGIVNQNYVQHSKEILMTMKRRGNCCLSGDGRCDSRGHNAKYLTYSFTDKEAGKIAAMSLIQVSEVDNSNQMEKKGFMKRLPIFKDKTVTHTQITMREKEPGINHQFDVWHFVKNIKKKLINASQKASCNILSKWVKSIGNHLR